MAEATKNRLRRLVLSAAELRSMTDWPPALVEDYLNILDDLVTLADGIDDISDQASNVTRITAGDSPYSIQQDDGTIFCNTTAGPITAVLPVGVQGEPHRIVNTGLSGNNVTIDASVGQKINGFVGTEALYDSESLELQFDENDGWY